MPQRRPLPHLWRFWYTAFWEYPGIGRRVLRNWPGLTRFLLRRGAAGPAAWQPGEVEEFVAASRQPGSARAGEALHWQFVLHDIPGIILRRHRSMKLTVPTVILAGAEDWILPPKMLAGAGYHAGDLQLRVVPGRGISWPMSGPRWWPKRPASCSSGADRRATMALIDGLTGKLSTRSLQSVHSILRRSIRQGQARDKVVRNVAELVTTPKGTTGRPSKALTLDQATAVLEHARKSPLCAYVALSLMTGVRTEEARALRWEHVVT